MANNVLAKMSVLISAQTASFNQALQRSQSQLHSFTGSIQRMAGQVGLAFGAFEAFNIVKSAINSIADFEKELSTVKAITGATDDEFKALKKSALDLGASTRYTSQQVAGLQVEYGRLGFSTSEILSATKATLNLATATGSDLAKAADVAGSTVRAFGLQASETQRVVDVMASSFNKSALGLENFSEAMKYVAPIARSANISVEETTAMLGVLADAGIRGSMAGTSLRKIISDVGGETGTLAERLQKLADKGLTGADAMDEVGRTAYASLLILTKNTDKTRQLTEALNDAAGAGQKAADVMEDNLTGDVTKLSSAYDGLIQSAGDASTALREVTQSLTKIVNLFTWLSRNKGIAGEIFDTISDISTAPIRALGWLAEQITGTTEQIEDHTEKLKAIESTVKAAFDSGNVEAYIKALDQNIYKEEIIAEIRKRQTDQLKEQVTQVKAVAAEVEKLSGFGRSQLLNARAGQQTQVSDVSFGVGDNPLSKESLQVQELIMNKNYLNEIRKKSGEAAREEAEVMSLAYDMIREKEAEAIESAMALGDAIGDGLGNALSDMKSFAQGLRGIAQTVLNEFKKMALAAIIKNAALTGKNPAVAIGLATAGFAAISALFSKIGSSSGGVSGGMAREASSNSRRENALSNAQDSSPQAAEVVLRGQDLHIIMQNYERSLKFTKG